MTNPKPPLDRIDPSAQRALYPHAIAAAPTPVEQHRAAELLANAPRDEAVVHAYVLGMYLANVRLGASRGLLLALADEADRALSEAGAL
jgi:hypothetical protein